MINSKFLLQKAEIEKDNTSNTIFKTISLAVLIQEIKPTRLIVT